MKPRFAYVKNFMNYQKDTKNKPKLAITSFSVDLLHEIHFKISISAFFRFYDV